MDFFHFGIANILILLIKKKEQHIVFIYRNKVDNMLYYNHKRKTTASYFWQSQNKKGNTLNETSVASQRLVFKVSVFLDTTKRVCF